MKNYLKDRFGKICLELAHNSKGEMRFGSVLVKEDVIIGKGWNKRSTGEERAALTHVDYAIHAEQGAVYDALVNGFDVTGAVCYVLGYSKSLDNLSVRDGKYFTCRKCPHTLIKYNIPVFIPTGKTWAKLSPMEALESAKEHMGHWTKFVKGVKNSKQSS